MLKKRPKAVVVAAYSLMLLIGILGVATGASMRSDERIHSIKYPKGRGLGRDAVIVFSAGFTVVGAIGIWDWLRKK